MQNAEGVESVAYETKVILIALANIIRNSNNLSEVYKAVEEMANAEGMVLKPYEEAKEE